MMTAEDNSRRRSDLDLFSEALEKPTPEARAIFLEKACAGDPVRRQRMEELLASHFAEDGFMQASAAGASMVPRSAGAVFEGPGSVIGRYTLLEKLGDGGCGVVYMAEQTSPVRRCVALKLIKPGMDTRQIIARFEAERQTLALMEHPNIAKVFDAGVTKTGRSYFVMELVRGVKLTDYCDQKRLSLRERLGLFARVCQATQHAHQKGVIHRDIKPSNILVTEHEGIALPKMIDFGIAKATKGQLLTERTVLTEIRQFIGTPAYMSPEQAVLTSADIDTRSDIYSLGVLLYELLTGTTPFESEALARSGVDEMHRIIREKEPLRPSTRLRTMLPGELELTAERRRSEAPRLIRFLRGDLDWIVMQCLEKDRTRRYETVNALLRDIERYQKDEAVTARPASSWYRLRKFARRNKVVLATASLLAVLLSSGAIGGTLLAIRARRAEALADRRLAAETEARGAAASAQRQAALERDQARRHLYEARLSYAQANRRSGEAGRRFASLQALGEAAPLGRTLGLGRNGLLALRNDAIACLALVDLRLDQKWEGYPPGSTLTGIAFDSEMERYARVDGNGYITVRRLADNQELVSIRDTEAPANERQPDWRMSLRFSPDGRFLAASGNRQYGGAPMQVWNLTGPRSILKLAPGNAWENAAFDFSPDSRVFAAGRPDGVILLYDTAEWKEVGRWTMGRPAWCLRFDPQGRELAVAIGSSVHLIDLEGRAFAHSLDHPSMVQSVCWKPAGNALATTCASGEGYLWDTVSGQRTSIPREVQDYLIGAVFNSRGDLLATPENDGTTRLRDASTGQELVRATGLASDFSRDGRWLGLGVFGPEVGRWEVASSSEHYLLHAHSPEVVVWGLSFSPDGHWLVSSGRDGVRLWDIRSRALLGRLPDPCDSVTFGETAESLFFCGTNGLCRWLLVVSSGSGVPRVQPRSPEFIPELSNPRPESVCLSADGQTMAVKLPGSARVVSLGENTVRELCTIQYPVLSVALSPDARWLASTAADAYEAKLWDATTGQWLRDFPGIRTGNASFTPDNRWLALATPEEYRFYQVGSWQPGLRLKREYAGYSSVSPAYDPSAPVAAIVFSARIVKIINLKTGEELAALTAPQPEEIRSLRFSPDGSLLAAGTAAGDIQLWDVQQLRHQLRALGLDWEQ